MVRRFAVETWKIAVDTVAQWRAHRSSEMAAALAFYGAIALGGLSLAAVYGAAMMFADHTLPGAAAQGRHAAGAANWAIVTAILREGKERAHAWVGGAVGLLAFIVAVGASALQLQRVLSVVWRTDAQRAKESVSKEARLHFGQFVLIYALAFALAILLFTGAVIHGLMKHAHAFSFAVSMGYQAADVAVSIVLQSALFLCIFTALADRNVDWRRIWPAAVVSAILYERGQFALALYIGQMDARSPYADAGAVLVILAWLYYCAQVVVLGAELSRVLQER